MVTGVQLGFVPVGVVMADSLADRLLVKTADINKQLRIASKSK
jgi:hypothetical protein